MHSSQSLQTGQSTRERRPTAAETPQHDRTEREARHVTILLVARLMDAAGVDHICRVRNISSGGLLIETGTPLAVGQPVRIELRNHQWVQGNVAWTDAPRAGIAFGSPADLGVLLQSTRSGVSGARVARSPRFTAECGVVIRCRGSVRHATLLDLSQRGAKLRATGLAKDDSLQVSVPGAGSCPAVVRWVRGGEVGIVFLETISFADLDRWLEDSTARFGARSAQPDEPAAP